MATKEDCIVLYPFPGMGHVAPMLELAKLFLPHNFHVSIALMDTPLTAGPVLQFIADVSPQFPSISFHNLPPHSVPVHHPDRSVALFHHLRHNNNNFRNLLRSHSHSCNVRALVLDFFCTDALDVAAEFDLPVYFFFTSGAYALAAFLYFPTLSQIMGTNLGELGGELLQFPGCPPIPANHLPKELLNRDTDVFKVLVYHFERLPKANGILVNTFESLERPAVEALRNGLCTPGRPTPPIHCVGPLIVDRKEECIVWLDSQPKKSVVLLCFGSMGTLSAEQLKEIAKGLEASEQRFIWVVRAPKQNGMVDSMEELTAEPELDSLLPFGFTDRGMVVKNWVPQRQVLAHEAVGGFVTHGGWNSMLESIVNGVPMIVWPLYAEQRMNKVFLVEEMRLGVEIKGYDEEIVKAEEVESKVRWLMASEELRERTESVSRAAAQAMNAGGSSEKAISQVVTELKANGRE